MIFWNKNSSVPDAHNQVLISKEQWKDAVFNKYERVNDIKQLIGLIDSLSGFEK